MCWWCRAACDGVGAQGSECMNVHAAIHWLRARFVITAFDANFLDLHQYVFLNPQWLIQALNTLTRPLGDQQATSAYKAKVQRRSKLFSSTR